SLPFRVLCSPTPPPPPPFPYTTLFRSPQFTESAFFLHDVGVVLLSKAFKLPADQYGKLPTQDQLDPLQPSASTTFTAVGYGLQQIGRAHVRTPVTSGSRMPSSA